MCWIFFPIQAATLFNSSKVLRYTHVAQLTQAERSWMCSQGVTHLEESSGLHLTLVLH